MFYNIGYTITMVTYCHSTAIAMVIQLYNTEWRYYIEIVVNYHGKKLHNIGPWRPKA
jgi:hypothetical protein